MQVDQLPVLISIHALREEGDLAALEKQETPEPISIHALREEGDPRKAVTGGNQGVFLSTPSARRATICLGDSAGHIRHFYPRPPRGGRRGAFLVIVYAQRISIHALREEGDWQAGH